MMHERAVPRRRLAGAAAAAATRALRNPGSDNPQTPSAPSCRISRRAYRPRRAGGRRFLASMALPRWSVSREQLTIVAGGPGIVPILFPNLRGSVLGRFAIWGLSFN